jgi:alkylation response protein AidB-like acyl-CoA dehydrogenase
MSRLPIGPDSSPEEIRQVVTEWVRDAVPRSWRGAAAEGGIEAVRRIRSYAEYEAWYPAFAGSGLVAPTWPAPYGGLDLSPGQAEIANECIAPFHLGRLNIIGLGAVAPALFAFGSDQQCLRFLPPMVGNQERWSQLLSEPGAGSDLASLATRAERDGDEWVVTGQKVWSTWAHRAEFANCLARTDPVRQKRSGLTYFVVDLRSPGVTVRPLRQMSGDSDFCEVFLDEVRVPDFHRVGPTGEGWRVVGATLSGERQMVSGAGSGGVDRIGGKGFDNLVASARQQRRTADPRLRQRLAGVYAQDRIRQWTNERIRVGRGAGHPMGALASVGKLHQGELNQLMQELAVDILGPAATGWPVPDPPSSVHSWHEGLPTEVRGMLRSRANTIEGGTSEVNRNVVAERMLGLPREPEPHRHSRWCDIPRN